MLNLESFMHRAQLAEIMARWMVNDPREGDIRRLKTVVNFNSYVARIWIEHLTRTTIRRFHGLEPERHALCMKGKLKDAVVASPTYTNARINEMLTRYRRYPEDFYRDTPIDGSYYLVGSEEGKFLAGGTRIKRFRRIAEKGSRRIIDFILERIRESADALAGERARDQGISLSQLVTSPTKMVEEFEHAERRVIKSIKRGTIRSDLPFLDIPDVVGAKVIVEQDDYGRFVDSLESAQGCEILEAERHTGVYNAVNLKVAYRLPKDLLLATPPSGQYLQIFGFRGFDIDAMPGLYRRFVEEAEDSVMVEVIVSTFQEYLESEIGRAMHEERVLEQRSTPNYGGHLATNVRYLLTYIFGLCRAREMDDVSDIPIKLWVKYMPDTIERIMRTMYLPKDKFFDLLPEPPHLLAEG